MLVLALGFQVRAYQAGEALVCGQPARLEIVTGQKATLQIRLQNARDSYGIDLQATFDPEVVEVVDADPKQSGVQMTPGTMLRPDFVVTNLVDNKTGRLHYVATQLNPSPAASGDGSVLLVELRGKRPEASSKLSFTAVVVADRRGAKQAVRTQPVELVILAAGAAIPTTSAVPRLTPTVTGQPGATPALIWTASQSNLEEELYNPEGEAGMQAGAGKRIVTTVTMVSIIVSAVLAGVCVCLFIGRRRKGKGARPDEDQELSASGNYDEP